MNRKEIINLSKRVDNLAIDIKRTYDLLNPENFNGLPGLKKEAEEAQQKFKKLLIKITLGELIMLHTSERKELQKLKGRAVPISSLKPTPLMEVCNTMIEAIYYQLATGERDSQLQGGEYMRKSRMSV